MEAPGLSHGRFLDACDVSTPGWRYDGASSLGCDGAPGSECSGVTWFIVPALGRARVPGFKVGIISWNSWLIGFQDSDVLECWASEAIELLNLRAQGQQVLS